jgi:hypothetical protein
VRQRQLEVRLRATEEAAVQEVESWHERAAEEARLREGIAEAAHESCMRAVPCRAMLCWAMLHRPRGHASSRYGCG